MGVTAALIIGAGAAISAGVGAYSSSQAGAASEAAGQQASAAYTAAAKSGSKSIQSATKKALALLSSSGEGYLDGTYQKAAVADNMAVLPGAKAVGRSVDRYNQNELNRMLAISLPGYKDAVQTAQNNTLSMLHGELPADVAAQVNRSSAETAKAGGFAGSESAGAVTARDLGLTSLNLMEEGSNSAQRWIQTARQYLTPTPFDPTSMFVTPAFVASGVTSATNSMASLIYGSAAKQADILTGGTKSATDAALSGDAAQIKANQQSMASIQQGIQGVSGAAAGMYMRSGSTGGGTPGYGGVYGGTFGSTAGLGDQASPTYL